MIVNEKKSSSDSSQIGWTFWLALSCITVTASASFAFGYGIGAPNQYTKFTEPFLRGQYNICDVDDNLIRLQHNCPSIRTPFSPQRKQFVNELINGLPQTLFILGCFIGAITGPLWYKLGKLCDRKRAFFINFPFLYLSCVAVIVAYFCRIPTLFYVSRLLHGYQSGMACTIVPPYINEISSQKVRGSAGVLHQFFVTFGILIAQIIGLPQILATYDLWVWGLAICFIPCVIASFIIPILPNSPSQLYITYRNENEAMKALRKLRGVSDVHEEMEALQKQAQTSSKKALSVGELLSSSELKWPIITTLVLLGAQALSGINAVFFYSGKIFQNAGLSQNHLPFAAVVTGFINVFITIATIKLIEKLGRKPLIIYPMLAMLITFLLLTIFIQVNEKLSSVSISYLCVVLVLFFICCFAVGLGPIAFIYPNEVFRQEARDAALSIGLCVNYAGNLLVSLFFPAINATLGGYVFLIFFVIMLLCLILLYFKMPETKNKSIQEIESFWN